MHDVSISCFPVLHVYNGIAVNCNSVVFIIEFAKSSGERSARRHRLD